MKLFGGGQTTTAAQGVARPRVVRMPTETDPTVLAAAQRSRKAALQRRGRLSTIMTERLMDRTQTGFGGIGPTSGQA